MCPELLAAFGDLFHPAALRPLIAGLRRRFTGLDPELVDDAVQTAAVELLRSPAVLPSAWARGGVAEIRRVLVVASWRGCLRQLRCPRATRELLQEEDSPQGVFAEHPEALLIAAEMRRAMRRVTRQAARQFGGRKADALVHALDERLGSDETDAQVAARHGLSRETLNRAKRWMVEQLQGA